MTCKYHRHNRNEPVRLCFITPGGEGMSQVPVKRFFLSRRSVNSFYEPGAIKHFDTLTTMLLVLFELFMGDPVEVTRAENVRTGSAREVVERVFDNPDSSPGLVVLLLRPALMNVEQLWILWSWMHREQLWMSAVISESAGQEMDSDSWSPMPNPLRDIVELSEEEGTVQIVFDGEFSLNLDDLNLSFVVDEVALSRLLWNRMPCRGGNWNSGSE
jgi:hypothetical protein